MAKNTTGSSGAGKKASRKKAKATAVNQQPKKPKAEEKKAKTYRTVEGAVDMSGLTIEQQMSVLSPFRFAADGVYVVGSKKG